MKLRWRKRPSATVLHFNVLMTLGSALPLAISSSRPFLSMGARHPVRAVLLTALLATAWVMRSPPCFMLQTVLYYAGAVPSRVEAKKAKGIRRRRRGRRAAKPIFRLKAAHRARILLAGRNRPVG